MLRWKRMLCLLLALLLLTVPALADGHRMTLTYVFSPEAADMMFAMGALDATEADLSLASAICQWIDSMALTMEWQDDALRLVWRVQDEAMADLVVSTDDEGVLVQSSLLPKIGIRVSRAQLADMGRELAEGRSDAQKLLQAVDDVLQTWMAKIKSREQDGHMDLSDRDLADLVERMLLRLEDDTALLRVLKGRSQETRVMINSIRQWNQNVREADRYAYRWTPAEGEAWYGTLEVFDGGEPYATLTLGAGEKGHRATARLQNAASLTRLSAEWNAETGSSTLMQVTPQQHEWVWYLQQSEWSGLDDLTRLQMKMAGWQARNDGSEMPSMDAFALIGGVELQTEATEGFTREQPEQLLDISNGAELNRAVQASEQAITDFSIHVFQTMPPELIVALMEQGIEGDVLPMPLP